MYNKNTDTKSITIRIPSDLLQELRCIAKLEYRSVNGQIYYMICKYVAEYNAQQSEFNDT